jgi:hypothetical protein
MSMRTFSDEAGREWVATAREEQTPRHHGRWFFVMHPADQPALEFSEPEVRWQTAASADRTLRTMSVFELRRRLGVVLGRPGAGRTTG